MGLLDSLLQEFYRMSMDSKDDIVIKIVIIGDDGKALEVQKQAWDVKDVTIDALKRNVKGSTKLPREYSKIPVNCVDEGSYLVIELFWKDKTGDQVRLQTGGELALALKE